MSMFRPAARSALASVVKKPLVGNGSRMIVQAPETKVTTLKSGIRVVSENFKIPTATVGVWIDGGSRYETKKTNGVAHFLEHMNFKGTKKRTQSALELEVENIGSHLNAYTSREQTVYFAKCFSKDIDKSVEILSDILLNSTYGSREIENERGVILREMQEVNQNMQEVVFDHLHAGAFEGCSLGGTILGPKENILSISRDDMHDYIRNFYKGQRMVLCGAGGVEHERLVESAEAYFGNIERGSDEVLEFEPGVFRNSYQVFENHNMEQIYGCLSVEGTSWTHPDNIAMQLINMMIGSYDRKQSQGISGASLLAEEVMKEGIAVEACMSFTTNYNDTGLTGCFFCVDDHRALQKLTQSVSKVWRRLCDKVDNALLESAKRTMILNMLLMLDGSTPICEDIGRQMLCYGRKMSVPELESRIQQVTPETVMEIARSYYVGSQFAYTVVGGSQGWPTEQEIRGWLC